MNYQTVASIDSPINVLVIGASGMVGHVLVRAFHNEGIKTTGTARRKIDDGTICLDLYNWEECKQFLLNTHFDAIFNCSGMLVNESNNNKPQALYINSLFPHLLVDFFKKTKTKIIHLSSGGVFSGNDDGYFEDNIVSPPTFYGLTKAAGEFSNDKDLVVRSDFWGPDNKASGVGLLNWFFNQKNEVKAYEDVYFNGISNIEFARIALKLMNCSGIINLGTTEMISKGNFLRRIKQRFTLDNIALVSDHSIKKKIFLKSNSNVLSINDYDTMIEDIYKYLHNNKQFYRNIYPQLFVN